MKLDFQAKITLDNTTNLLYSIIRNKGEDNILMKRTFKEMDSFTKKWTAMGLNDDDLIVLQELLLKDPKIGDVIPGASGIRKIRIPVDGIGKRSGGRVIYIDIEVKECIYLLDVYAKNERQICQKRKRSCLASWLSV